MKLNIIGWTSYDDSRFETAGVTWAYKHALLDDIVKNKYLFTGYHHQEFDKCVPVFNNGKKVIFSQRGFGGVMAEAQGLKGLYDYSLYAYTPNPYSKQYNLPTKKPDEGLIVSDKELIERYNVSVDMESFAKADILERLQLKDIKEYRYLAENDIINLICGEQSMTYDVLSVDREKDVDYTTEYNFKYRSSNLFTEEQKEQIIKDYVNAENRIVLKLAYRFFK
ncbi:MAG: hypothetical protein IJW13_04095 [Clostridia bacterium]|nr:hypothetical protein [Clostridia bacterium]